MHGYVISDLHLFTRRSSHAESLDTLHDSLKNADILVLNGDIVDFRWSTYPNATATAVAAIEWLNSLLTHFPDCTIHYVLGNHDAWVLFTQALDDLAAMQPRFHWHPSHWQRSEHLFLHGDLPLSGRNPFERPLHIRADSMPSLLHDAYDTVVDFGLHRFAEVMFTPRRCAKKIKASLDEHGGPLGRIRHVYFGHTHAPFTDFEYGGIMFHNTGATVRGVKNHILKVELP